MKPEILISNTSKEFFTPERCHIIEEWNTPEDAALSIARARVEPGIGTALHYLEGVDERYIITQGMGKVEVGDLPPTDVSVGDVVVIPDGTSQCITNTGATDLIFYCICTPRFNPDCYREIKID